MDIVWFSLGALTVTLIWVLQNWKAKYNCKLSPLTWGGVGTSIFLLLFTLAWSISSVAEGEPQAAGMGLLVIGGCTLITFALTRKLAMRDVAATED